MLSNEVHGCDRVLARWDGKAGKEVLEPKPGSGTEVGDASPKDTDATSSVAHRGQANEAPEERFSGTSGADAKGATASGADMPPGRQMRLPYFIFIRASP